MRSGIRHVDGDFRLLAADDGFEALEDVVDAGAEAEGLDLERAGLAGFEAGDDQHVLDDAGDAVGVLAHHREEAPGDLRVLEHVVVEQVFEVAVDDGQRGAQFVGGVGDEVLADLLGLVLGGHVADDDTGGGVAAVGGGQAGGIDDPGVDAAGFEIAARARPAGGGRRGLDGLAGFEAVEQGVGEAGVEEGLADRAVDEFAPAEQVARGGVGEADVACGIDQQEGVAEGVEQAVALVAGLLESCSSGRFQALTSACG